MVANAISLLSFYIVKVPFENISLPAANQHSSLDGMLNRTIAKPTRRSHLPLRGSSKMK